MHRFKNYNETVMKCAVFYYIAGFENYHKVLFIFLKVAKYRWLKICRAFLELVRLYSFYLSPLHPH